MKIIIIFAAVFLISCGASAPVKEVEEVKIPTLQEISSLEVVFADAASIPAVGAVNTDDPGASYGAQMYPGYNGASFLAGILTHAIIQSGVSANAEKKRQEIANQVLDKYSLLGDGYPVAHLQWDESVVKVANNELELSHTIPSEENAIAGPLYAALYPVLIMPHTEESLILQNEVRVYSVEDTQSPLHVATVEVVHSPDCGEEGPFDYWTGNDGEQLHFAVQSMFNESLELALNSETIKAAVANKKTQTIRYLENGAKKVERGYVLESFCDRIHFITLRGVIKSAPSLQNTCVTSF